MARLVEKLMETLCQIGRDPKASTSENISRRAQALVETLANRELTDRVNKRPDSMTHIAYLRFRFLHRQFQGGSSSLVIPAAVSTGRTIVQRWKALRGDES
jgi:hypothetical protein